MTHAAPSQQISLFCLPFSGGTVYSYQKFKPHFPKSVVMIPVELPGHGKRIREPLLTDIHAMIENLYAQIRPKLQTPYALYGHSLGALLSYLLICKFAREQAPLPFHLFVSGHQGPSIPEKDKNLHLLPRQEFILRLQQYGGIPQEVAEHNELMDLFVPMMKADFQAISEYQYTPAPKLNLPITVMFGSKDEISREEALAWQEVAAQKIQLQEFSGRHFFIFEHPQAIAQLISHTLFRNFA